MLPIEVVQGMSILKKDDNYAYVIAQFFPRMCVYNDVEGWQNYQFWGNGEFALVFGDYDVNITVPADHIVDATGELQNRKEVFSKTMMNRYEQSKKVIRQASNDSYIKLKLKQMKKVVLQLKKLGNLAS